MKAMSHMDIFPARELWFRKKYFPRRWQLECQTMRVCQAA